MVVIAGAATTPVFFVFFVFFCMLGGEL